MQKRFQLISNIQTCSTHFTRDEFKTVCDIRMSHIFWPTYVCSLCLQFADDAFTMFWTGEDECEFSASCQSQHQRCDMDVLACWSDWSTLMQNTLSVISLTLIIRWNACFKRYKCNDQQSEIMSHARNILVRSTYHRRLHFKNFVLKSI